MLIFSIIQKSKLEGANRLDAEYYQPEYLMLEKQIIKSSHYKLWREIEGRFITGPFGSEFDVEHYVSKGEYRYVRGKDVKNFLLEDNDNVYIPKSDFERLKKYALSNSDILISVVGTLGNTVVVDKSVIPAIFSCKSTVFRTKSVNPFYFVTYLHTRYGHGLLEKSVRGALQTGLNIDDLKSLPIYLPSREEQDIIGGIVQKSRAYSEESKEFYLQAEKLFLSELGMWDYELESELSNVVNFSEVKTAERMDAEYFQPKYEKLENKIKRHNAQRLGDLVTLKKGFEPGAEAYEEEGKLFIRVSSLTKQGIIDKDQKYLSEHLYKELKKDYEPKVGEILLTKDASPGVAYVVKEPVEGIISGGVVRLKLKEQNIYPEYLALCISSLVGQAQVQRDAGGSVIMHWKPEQIKNLLLPILPLNIQKKISDLVIQSHEARTRAKELLEAAKQKVEALIEQGE